MSGTLRVARKLSKNHPQRYLCICQGGNVRSVALATVLKQKYHQEAIAVGFERSSEGTLAMLAEWANVIIVMMDPYRFCIPVEYQEKVIVCDVGEDTYGRPGHDRLVAQVDAFAKGLRYGTNDDV